MTADWPDFNDQWDYDDPARTEGRLRALLPAAEALGDVSYRLQLLTQIARTLGLQSRFDDAHALLDQVERAMTGGDVVEVRYLLERGRVFNSAHQPVRAVPLFRRAADLASQLGAHFYAVDALHMLGIAAPPADRLEWNLRAIAYVEQTADERAQTWLGSLYNNAGWTLFDAERYAEALDLFQKAQAVREAQGDLEAVRIARWSVARTIRALGRPAEALTLQRALKEMGSLDGFVDEEIAECLYALGQIDAARPYFKNAFDALSQIPWVAQDSARLDRLRSLADSA